VELHLPGLYAQACKFGKEFSEVDMKLQTPLRLLLKTLMLRITSSQLMGYSFLFYPMKRECYSYAIPKLPDRHSQEELSTLPIPPKSTWGSYGDTAQVYLESGKRDCDKMQGILEKAGSPLEECSRILEFGCSTGRMIRWLGDVAQKREVWGVDITAGDIVWCSQHLSPPFHFVTTTLLPHLPFEDRYFDLIYAGSVFTHIDDLAKTWLLELCRVLRPGGRLYITISDRHTIEVLDKLPDHWYSRYLQARSEYRKFAKSDFGMFTIDRHIASQVFYDVDYFCQMLKPVFEVISVVPEAYGFQTGVLLRRSDGGR
jgi:ubiquinone/menaquinone biosynthesis C-methylase UbiE